MRVTRAAWMSTDFLNATLVIELIFNSNNKPRDQNFFQHLNVN